MARLACSFLAIVLVCIVCVCVCVCVVYVCVYLVGHSGQYDREQCDIQR